MNPRHHPPLLAPVLFATLAITVCACTQIRTQTDYNRQADFARLRTYAWLPDLKATSDPRLDSSLLDARIRRSVERQLGAKGYEKSEAPTASFLVAYQIYMQRKTELVAEPIGPYGYRWWGGMGATRTYQYDEGTLLLDVINPQTNELMWRGSATAIVDPGASPQEREERIDRAVRSLLEKFPPS